MRAAWILAATISIGGCAAQPPAPATAADPPLASADPASQRAVKDEPPPYREPPPPPEKKVTVGDLVRNAKDDMECEREVKRLVQIATPEVALSILDACARANKFRNLRMMFNEPWRDYTSRLAEAKRMELFANVVANRGMLESDFELLRENGIALYRMSDAFANPRGLVNRYVLMRGIVTGQRDGERGRFLVELAETQRMTTDREGEYEEYTSRRKIGVGGKPTGPELSRSYEGRRYGKVGSLDSSQETGRTVTATALEVVRDLLIDAEYAVLGKFKGMREHSPEEAAIVDGDGTEHGEVWLVRTYKIGVVLPEISR